MRKLAVAFTGTAVAATVVVGGVAPGASAIQRSPFCAPNEVRLISNETTCWLGAGATSVTLYNVYRVNGGQYNGYIRQGAFSSYYFYKNQATNVPSQYAVTYINIY